MRPGADGPRLIGILALLGARVKRAKQPLIGGECWRVRLSRGQIGRRVGFECQFVHPRSNGFDSPEFRELAAKIRWTGEAAGVLIPASWGWIQRTAAVRRGWHAACSVVLVALEVRGHDP